MCRVTSAWEELFTGRLLFLHWRFEPALDVQDQPWFLSVFLYRPYQQILPDIIEGNHDRLPIISTFPNA
jgi:hypothetical protein